MEITKQIRRRDGSTKAQLLSEAIREMAHKKGPDSKLPTTREFCRLLDTTPITLDNALNDLEAQNVIVRKQGSGIFVSPKIHHKSIAVAFGNVHNSRPGASPFWGMLQGLFIDEAQRRAQHRDETYSFHVIPHVSQRDNPAILESLGSSIRAGQIHGLLAVCVDAVSACGIQWQGVPVVSYAAPGDWVVEYDSLALLQAAVDQLAARGCRRIAFIDDILFYDIPPDLATNSEPDIPTELRRICASAEPRIELIDIKSRRISDLDQFNRLSCQDYGYQVAMEIFGSRQTPLPDGVLIMNDMITSGALAALRKLEVQPGRDVKIVTSANMGSPTLYGWEEELILIEADPREIVMTMLDTMDATLCGHRPNEQRVRLNYNVRSR